MSIAQSVLVVYRQGDSDSLAVAQTYADRYGVDSEQVISVPCSNTEILDSYSTFYDEVETTVAAAIRSASNSIRYIILSYNVPGGFIYEGHNYSSTSRLSRVLHQFNPRVRNPLFNRKDMASPTGVAYNAAIICSRIDAPSVTIAKQMIGNAIKVSQQGYANGKFYIDPYPQDTTSGNDSAANASTYVPPNDSITDYIDELTEFVDRTLPLLGLTVFSTTSRGTWRELVLPFVQNDSFTWSYGAQTSGSAFFRDGPEARFFFYNADTANAVTLRNADSNRWPYLAMLNGYAATVGTMEDWGASYYLRPRAFFNALMNGATIGEAYLMAVPRLDSSEVLIGDPLVTVAFPDANLPPVKTTTGLSTQLIIDQAAQGVGWIKRKETLSSSIEGIIDDCGDNNFKLAVQTLAENLTLSLNEAFSLSLNPASKTMWNLLVTDNNRNVTTTQIEDYLTEDNVQIPKVLADALANNGIDLDDSFTLEDGSWQVDHVIENVRPYEGSIFHFEIDVASDAEFNDILFSADSESSSYGWYYQREVNLFEGIPTSGIASSYIGRGVRYKSGVTESMSTADKLYIRIRQKDDSGPYDYVYQQHVVVT